MAKSKINSNYTVPLRRKREGLTNYKKRMAYLKSGFTRLVIRTTNQNVVVQLVNYGVEGDVVLATVDSKSLKAHGWKFDGGNMPTAYLCGLLIGKTKAKGISKQVIIDFGLQRAVSGTRLYAVVKGAKDAGLNIDIADDHLPTDDRVSGKHIEEFAKSMSKEAYAKQYSKLSKEGIKPESITSEFETVKDKILGA